MRQVTGRWLLVLALCVGGLGVAFAGGAWAQEAQVATEAVVDAVEVSAEDASADPLVTVVDKVGDVVVAIDTMWVLIAAFLVFFMNLGFAMVESGLCRSKNTVNILAKNFIVFACASLGFYFLGWGLMFGNDGGDAAGAEKGFFNSLVGTVGLFAVGGEDNSPATLADYVGDYASISWAGVPLWAKFFFQLVFAGTAATIVSGAVAERIKFLSFIVFSIVLCALIYPVTGHMIWGGGYLFDIGFWDFAGSTTVHSVGGWAALAGVIVLGPRLGKYNKDGSSNVIPGHSLASVTLGALVLWFGWFGFNPGSTMAAVGYADAIAHIAVTTNSGAIAAIITSAITSWLMQGKPDLTMIVNGCLAGLVSVTAGCAFISVPSALVIGAIAGVIVVFSVIALDKARLDDPVGALSVHLVNGIWGTIAVGLFAQSQASFDWMPGTALTKDGLFFGGGAEQLMAQIKGVLLVGVIVLPLSLVAWVVIKAVLGLRVSDEEQIEGLDLGEHDQSAYPDFQTTYIKSYHAREM